MNDAAMTPTTLAPEAEAAIRERAAEFMAERPDEPEWSPRRRGEAYFTAAYDRRMLLAELDAARAENARLTKAIETVLADSESQHPGGWGPDVTTVKYLRAALKGT